MIKKALYKIIVKVMRVVIKNIPGALINYWTCFLMFNILHDPRSRMTKLSYMIKQFQIDVQKRLVDFQCRTISLSVCAKHLCAVLIYLNTT